MKPLKFKSKIIDNGVCFFEDKDYEDDIFSVTGQKLSLPYIDTPTHIVITYIIAHS